MFTLFVGPGFVHVCGDDLRINVQKCLAHILGEGEVGLPVTAVDIIIENSADAARLVPVRQEEILVAPFLELRIVLGSCLSQALRNARWKASVSSSLGYIGVRSPPPPNQGLDVTINRVFICAAGTSGERMWDTSEIPDAQNRGRLPRRGCSFGTPLRIRRERLIY